MGESFAVDPDLIQEIVYYGDSRFKKIIIAMEKLGKAPERRHLWMQACLRKELVSSYFFKTIITI